MGHGAHLSDSQGFYIFKWMLFVWGADTDTFIMRVISLFAVAILSLQSRLFLVWLAVLDEDKAKAAVFNYGHSGSKIYGK